VGALPRHALAGAGGRLGSRRDVSVAVETRGMALQSARTVSRTVSRARGAGMASGVVAAETLQHRFGASSGAYRISENNCGNAAEK